MDIIFTIISVICFVHSFLVFIDVERDFLHPLVHCFLDYLLEYFILINLHVHNKYQIWGKNQTIESQNVVSMKMFVSFFLIHWIHIHVYEHSMWVLVSMHVHFSFKVNTICFFCCINTCVYIAEITPLYKFNIERSSDL